METRARPVTVSVTYARFIGVSFAVLWSACCGARVRGRSGVGLPPVEPSHALGDDGRAGLAVGGGAVGLGRCVVALDGEGAGLATVRVNDGRDGCGGVHRWTPALVAGGCC